MIKNILIFIFYVLVTSCQKKEVQKTSYNEKANELISQIILNESCSCLLEISPESMIKVSKMENPIFDIRKKLMIELRLNDKAILDSLENASLSFKLDTALIYKKKRDFKIINKEQLVALSKGNIHENMKICPKGITIIQNPIFDINFKVAVIRKGYAFTCVGASLLTYRHQKNKWVLK